MNKIRYVLLCGLVLILSGCKLVILEPKGIIAATEKNLLIDATLLMLIVVIPVIILTFVFAWKYRESNSKANYQPEWCHSTLLEIIWWSIPCIIIAVLATLTWISTHQLDPYRPIDSKVQPITIEAIALDWKWLFIYPDQQIATVNYLQIPTGVPIRFLITADAPMNSLEIPQLAGQIYAMTGMQTKLYLMASEPGDYTGLSTNYSGEGFSNMNFAVRASSQQQFDEWVKATQNSPQKLSMDAYNQLTRPSINNSVSYYSSPENNLFHMILMKYMGPDMVMGD